MANKGFKLNTIPPVDRLTPVEQRIWDLHQQGKTRKEIGLELNMLPLSVARRMIEIREKVAVMNYGR